MLFEKIRIFTRNKRTFIEYLNKNIEIVIQYTIYLYDYIYNNDSIQIEITE